MKTAQWIAIQLVSALGAVAVTTTAPLIVTAQERVVVPREGAELQIKPLQLDINPENFFVLTDADEKDGDAGATEYWLGVQVAAVPEIAKRQLAIDHGLAVEDVAPDSPAAKANIMKYDILMEAGDKPLANVEDLVKSVEAAKGKRIVILLKRDGESRKVEAVAEQKAKAEAALDAARKKIEAQKPKLAAEMKQLEEAIEKLKAAAGKEGFGMWFAKPAIVGPPGHGEMHFDFRTKEDGKKTLTADLPKDLSVQINKKGNEPTKIHVKKGDQEWDVTEDKLGDLPDDIRGHVQKMLGHMKGPTVIANAERKIRLMPDGKIEGEFRIPPMPPVPPMPPGQPAAPGRSTATGRTITSRVERDSNATDSKLDAIMKKLDKLEREIDELRDKK